MSAFVAAILADLWPIIAAVAGALGWGLYQRREGAKSEKAKRDAERLKSRTEADRIEDAIAGRDPDDNREELRKWSRR
ncbi:MAG: hypothetical protein IH582_03005 [Afipia sp.]|nr:hypothetical protein [Afipia sp.]